MAKKYITLQQAAKRLGITPEELARQRESGAIRGFANRGSWKFRERDIDEFARSREVDSSTEIPLKALARMRVMLKVPETNLIHPTAMCSCIQRRPYLMTTTLQI